MSSDRLLDFEGIRREVRRLTGRNLSFSTVYRWTTLGIAGVRLPVVVIGRKTYVSRSALEQFFETAAKARLDRLQPTQPPRTPAQRRRASRKAAAELARRGA